VTGLTLLLAGVDYFMMMHPAAAREVKKMITNLTSGRKPGEPVDWVSLRL
jgi:CO dehydrogenase/acetyl-CoA synthase delta subunit